MRLYNTLSRSLEEFVPLKPPTVAMYVCGPTVYDDPHIGHARSAYIFDVLSRYLRHTRYDVTFVRNVTDVDDKIIEKARHQTSDIRHQTTDVAARCRDVAERYLKSYHETMERLGIGRPTLEPRATEHVVPVMTDFISKLLMEGAAYETTSGDVYFSVRKFPGYGKLSNRTLDELNAGVRVEPGEAKQDPLDFALWKAAKPDEPSWDSPWGKGRPGWHIECSAMSAKYLGDQFDIHGGGVDLVFPHHENEIAQAQAVGKKFARYWIHNGLLSVNGEKMSKSLGNFITVNQALKGCRGEADILKTFFLGAHYRSPIDYTQSHLDAAAARYDGLSGFLSNADFFGTRQFAAANMPPDVTPQEVVELNNEFERAMDDDLNTPRAFAVLDELAGIGHQWLEEFKRLGAEGERDEEYVSANTFVRKSMAAAAAIQKLGALLGLAFAFEVELTPDIKALIRKREEARRQGDFKTADAYREQLRQSTPPVEIEDTPFGPIPRRKR